MSQSQTQTRPPAASWAPPPRPSSAAAPTTNVWQPVVLPGDPIQRASLVVLRCAGTEIWPSTTTEQQLLLRKARARAHPDRRNGDRAAWDELEDAARCLGLL